MSTHNVANKRLQSYNIVDTKNKTQEYKDIDIKWYKQTIRKNIYYELKTARQDKLGRIKITMPNVPPRIFDELFRKHKGTTWDGQLFALREKFSKPGHSKTTTDFEDNELPYGFICSKFNNNLSFKVTRQDHIQTDLKKVNLVYTKPLGILTIEALTWWKMPHSPGWQSSQ